MRPASRSIASLPSIWIESAPTTPARRCINVQTVGRSLASFAATSGSVENAESPIVSSRQHLRLRKRATSPLEPCSSYFLHLRPLPRQYLATSTSPRYPVNAGDSSRSASTSAAYVSQEQEQDEDEIHHSSGHYQQYSQPRIYDYYNDGYPGSEETARRWSSNDGYGPELEMDLSHPGGNGKGNWRTDRQSQVSHHWGYGHERVQYPFHGSVRERLGLVESLDVVWEKGDDYGEKRNWDKYAGKAEEEKDNAEQSRAAAVVARTAVEQEIRAEADWVGDRRRDVRRKEGHVAQDEESRALGPLSQPLSRSLDRNHAESSSAAASTSLLDTPSYAPLNFNWPTIRNELAQPEFSKQNTPNLHSILSGRIGAKADIETDLEQLMGIMRESASKAEWERLRKWGWQAKKTGAPWTYLAYEAALGIAAFTRDTSYIRNRLKELVKAVTEDDSLLLVYALLSTFDAYEKLGPGKLKEVDSLIITCGGQVDFLAGGRTLGLSAKELELRDRVYDRLRKQDYLRSWISKACGAQTDPGSKARQSAAGGMAIMAMLSNECQVDSALELYNKLIADGIKVKTPAAYQICSHLAQQGQLESALQVYSTQLESRDAHITINNVFQEGIDLLLGAGRSVDAFTLYKRLRAKNVQFRSALLLHLFSVLVQDGEANLALELAALAFPAEYQFLRDGAPRNREDFLPGPDARAIFSRLLGLYAHQRDMESVRLAIEAFKGIGATLEVSEYNILLFLFAHTGQESAALGLYHDMVKSGCSPDSRSVNALALLCSRARDPEAAKLLVIRAQEQGIALGPETLNTVFNAYIDAGDFASASKIWTTLTSSVKSYPSVTTSVLKGLVRLAAPFEEVKRFFNTAFRDPSTSNNRAWLYLIKSACDAGLMATAKDLVNDLKVLSGQNRHLLVNEHVYSTLMVGFLRVGQYQEASSLMEDLLRRNLVANSVIYGIVLKAMAENKWTLREDSTDLQKFLAAVLANMRNQGGSARDMANILNPMIMASGKNFDLKSAETYYRQATSISGPTIPLLTVLLTAVSRKAPDESPRRTAERQKRLDEIWRQIFSMAHLDLQRTRLMDPLKRPSRYDLCTPLSVYLESLSEEGRHEAAMQAWQDVGAAGFRYNAHNWNHYAVALLRGGQVEKAFQICEEILIPAQEEVDSRDVRAMRGINETFDDIGETTPSASGSWQSDYLMPRLDDSVVPLSRVDDASNRTPAVRASDWDKAALIEESRHERKTSDDLVIFDQWRPADSAWRPFYYTQDCLSMAYQQLKNGNRSLHVNGRLVALVGLGDDEADVDTEPPSDHEYLPQAKLLSDIDERHQEATRSRGRGDGGILIRADQQEKPKKQSLGPLALLAKLDRKYAKTVSLIALHRRKRRDATRRARQEE